MAIPVILCGNRTQIAASVIAALKPEYDVIHLITTPADGEVQIPQILKGEPAASATDLGSKDYSSTPLAVLLGAGYEEDSIIAMRKAVKDSGAPEIAWLRPDTSKPAPPLGPEYGKALVARIKELLGEMQKDGTLKVGTEGFSGIRF